MCPPVHLSLPLALQLVAGGRQLALPLSLRRASPELLALFLACVWTEVSCVHMEILGLGKRHCCG